MVSTADRSNWMTPTVTTDDRGLTLVEFRDCTVEVRAGSVMRYTDKVHAVYLTPADGAETWTVYSADGEDTGQIWRGIVAFDGSQLLVQQSRNALFRLYRTDGTIETQLRIARIVERFGVRTTYFRTGEYIEEFECEGSIRTFWGERIIHRETAGAVFVFDVDGNEIDPSSASAAEAVGSELLAAFSRSLSRWEEFSPPEQNAEFYFGGPPGFSGVAPGEYFRQAVPDKPDDIREVLSHDFNDGTTLHEYRGRLNGVPFVGQELVTDKGLVLARMVEYDQPKKITFCDPRGLIREFPAVRMVEMQYDPQLGDYVTCITDPDGVEFVHPKGAVFERFE